jgi:hypothetical protein
MSRPQLSKQHLTAEAITQADWRVAPVMRAAAISATAPTIQKGFGAAVGLGTWQQRVSAAAAAAAPADGKSASVSYAAPTLIFAQPIIQQADMSRPALSKQTLTAEAIFQGDSRIAPVMRPQPILATAPTMQKGFGTPVALGAWQQRVELAGSEARQNSNQLNWQSNEQPGRAAALLQQPQPIQQRVGVAALNSAAAQAPWFQQVAQAFQQQQPKQMQMREAGRQLSMSEARGPQVQTTQADETNTSEAQTDSDSDSDSDRAFVPFGQPSDRMESCTCDL